MTDDNDDGSSTGDVGGEFGDPETSMSTTEAVDVPDGDGDAQAEPDERDSGGRIVKNIVSMLASQGVIWAFSAVALVIVPRALGPDAMGKLGFALAVWGIATVVIGFGSPLVITRETARDPEAGNRVRAAAIPIYVVLFALVSAGMALYLFIADVEPLVQRLFFIVSIACFLDLLRKNLIQSLLGREAVTTVATINVIDRAFAAVLTVVAVSVGFGVEVVAAVSIVTALIGVSLCLYFFRRDDQLVLGVSFDRENAREVIKKSFPFLVLAGTFRFYHEIDVLALRAMADDVAVGHYSASERLIGAMITIPAGVSLALYPTLARRWVDDPDGVIVTLRTAITMLFIVTIPLAVGALMLGEELAVELLGQEFQKSGGVMQLYGLAMIPISCTILIGMYTQISNQEMVWTKVLFVSGLATIPLDLVLVPWARDSLDNAAMAGGITYFLTEAGAAVFGLVVLVPTVFDARTANRLSRAVASGGVMAIVVWLLHGFYFIVPLAVGGMVYVVAAFATGAVNLAELTTLGGPFERLSRFTRATADGRAVEE